MSNDNIYVAVVNPKGEKNGEVTEFMEENQLLVAAKLLPGLPLHINHNTEYNLGFPVEPAGIVTGGRVDENGRLVATFKVADNINGQIAKTLLGETGELPPELCMGEVSLGYGLKKLESSGIPMFHSPQELSICFKGAREGTTILGAVSEREVKEKRNEQIYNGLLDVHKTVETIFKNN